MPFYIGNDRIKDFYIGDQSMNKIYIGSNLVFNKNLILFKNGTVEDGFTVTTNGALNGNTGFKAISYTAGKGLVTTAAASGSTYYGRAWLNRVDVTRFKTITFKLNNTGRQWYYERYPNTGMHNNADRFSSTRYAYFGVATNTVNGTNIPNFAASILINTGAVGAKFNNEYTIDITGVTGPVYPTFMTRWTDSGIFDAIVTDIVLT